MTTPNRPSAFARFLGHPPTKTDYFLLEALAFVVSLLLICSFCVILPALGVRLGGGSTSHVTTAPRATDAVTATPLQTATPSGPQALIEAVLGGKKEAFTASYGAPSQSWDGGGIYSYTSNGTPVFINASSNSGIDGSLHIVTVSVVPTSGVYGPGLALQTAHDICSIFLPSDAVHVTDKTFNDGTHEYVFTSARLAATLPASWFHDPLNQSVPAGTLNVATTPSTSAPGRVAFCKVEPGRF
jgi:hypothetical protein